MKFKRGIVAGTFDCLHDGHRLLLKKARGSCEKLLVGITTEEYVRRYKGGAAARYGKREGRVRALLGEKGVEYFPLQDAVGPGAMVTDVDAIFVSEGTVEKAKEINRLRGKAGLAPLTIVEVPLVCGEDLKPISCERINAGIIDGHGKRKKPVVIAVGSTNPAKLKGVERALKRLCKVPCVVKGMKVASFAQPMGHATVRGAVARAKNAFEEGKVDYGIGLESGIFSFGGKNMDVLFCAVCDESGITLGNSMGFEVPGKLIEHIIKRGMDLSDAFEEVYGVKEVGKGKGAIGFFSKGIFERAHMAEQALLCAMIPRIARAEYGNHGR